VRGLSGKMPQYRDREAAESAAGQLSLYVCFPAQLGRESQHVRFFYFSIFVSIIARGSWMI